MTINFSANSTRSVAIQLYERLQSNIFQVLTLPTGAGKTAVAVATAGIFAHKRKQDINVFVIAPRSKIDEDSWQWTVDEYNKIAKYKLHVIDQSTPQGLTHANKNDKYLKKELKEMDPKKVENMKFLKKWYRQTLEKPTIFLIDECHMFKNPTASQAKALNKLIKSSIGIGLSATPMSNGLVQDGVSYLVLNNIHMSKKNFTDKHVPPHCFDEFYRPDVYLENGDIDPNRFYDLPKFQNDVKRTVFAPEVEVDFDMPDVSIHTVTYTLSENTRKDIKAINKDYRERRYDSYMLYLSDLRQAIARDLNHAREIVKIMRKTKPKQPLIFYHTDAELETIQFALDKMNYKYSMINGKHKLKDVDITDTNQAIIIQYKAGGAGIEFKQSNLTIFYGLQYSWQDTEQALGRNVRRGSTHKVNQVFTVAQNPHDMKVFEALQRKENFTKAFLQELAKDVSKEDD